MKFDEKKWIEYTEDASPKFDGIAYLSGLIHNPDVMRADLLKGLGTAVANGAGELKIRAFRPGRLDYELTQALSRTALDADKEASDWLFRVSKDKYACLAVNNICAWSLPLSESVAKMVGAMRRDGAAEFPSGIDSYAFVANSGWTPFGVHRDPEPSLIFHLGPESKEVYVWEGDSLQPEYIAPSRAFGDITFEIESQLSGARRFVLAPGDFLCIPAGLYHVFRNLGPSTFLGMSPYPAKYRRLLTEALWKVTGLEDCSDVSCGGSTRQALDQVEKLCADTASLPELKRLLSEQILLDQVRLHTSSYLGTPHRTALPTGAIDDRTRVRWAYPGVLEAVTSGEETILLARGREARFNTLIDFSALENATRTPEVTDCGDVVNHFPRELHGRYREQLKLHLFRTGALVEA